MADIVYTNDSKYQTDMDEFLGSLIGKKITDKGFDLQYGYFLVLEDGECAVSLGMEPAWFTARRQ
jgi:hypothetical protein